MHSRLIIVAAISFVLGAAADQSVRVTSYDKVIATMQRHIDI
jgi:hypothetical protein